MANQNTLDRISDISIYDIFTHMRYNGDGKRVQLVCSEGTTNYIYDGNSTIFETDNNGNITKKYNSGISMEKFGQDGEAKQVFYYLYDGLGDVCNLTDENGNIVQTYYYDVFGKSTNVVHDPTNKKQFTGKEVDEDSGLEYFIARYYDPETGRFLSKDPVPHANDYVYCDNDPIDKIDPDGEMDLGKAFGDLWNGAKNIGKSVVNVFSGKKADNGENAKEEQVKKSVPKEVKKKQVGFWEYWISTGQMFHVVLNDDNTLSYAFKGYGHAGNGKGMDNPDMREEYNVGPLSTGWYTIKKANLTGKEDFPRLALDPMWASLSENRTGGFQIHPEGYSEGCIGLKDKNLIYEINNSPDKDLIVRTGPNYNDISAEVVLK